MSDNLRIEVNAKDLRDLEEMPRRAEVSTRDVLAKIADYALQEVKASAPVRSGKVRGSFSVSVPPGQLPTAAIESNWFVARLQEYGYREHYHYLPSGGRMLIPGKAHNPSGYYAHPAVERAISYLAEAGVEEVVRSL